MKDHYHILGISRNALPPEIKKAYKRLAFEYHPDRNSGNKEKEQQFRYIRNAYEVLSDHKRKMYYDARINNATVNPYFDLRKEKENFVSILRAQEQSEASAILEQNQTLFFSLAALGIAAGVGYESGEAYQEHNNSVGDLFFGIALFTAIMGTIFTRKALKRKKMHQQRKEELEDLVNLFSNHHRK